jgi:hypothetical protein
MLSVAMLAGLATTAALAVAYAFVGDRAESPLAVFVIPLIVVAAVGTWREALLIALVCTAVALIVGLADDELSGPGFATRIVIIVTCGAVGALVAVRRSQHIAELERTAAQTALLQIFESTLAPQPVPPAFARVEARYRAAADGMQLGGDFYDVLELPDRSLGYIIGDVCGQGATAAALGSAIRAGWKTIAHHAPCDPQGWARSLDISFFGHGRRDVYVTVNTGRIDSSGTNLVYVSAGHPWPIYIEANARMLAPVANLPLGVKPGAPYACSRATLSKNSTLLLFTDGLYEGRSGLRSMRGNDVDVVEYVAARKGPLDLDSLLADFAPHGYHDDVAVLAITIVGQARV